MSNKKSTGKGGYNNTQRNERRKKKIEYLISQGIDTTIITKYRLFDKGYKTLQDPTNLRTWRKESGYKRRTRTISQKKKQNLQRLKDAGYKTSEIRQAWLTRNKDYIDHLVFNKLYRSKIYLLVMFAEAGLGALPNYTTGAYSGYTIDDIFDAINTRIDESNEDEDGSGSMNGVFIIYSGSKHACESVAGNYSNRGYNIKIGKFTREPYDTLCIRNDWTQRELSELTLFIISNCLNSDVINICNGIKNYIKKGNLPFNELYEIL